MTAPTPGTIEGGHRFKGGDPANPSSWEKVGPVKGEAQDGYRFKGGDPAERGNWEPISTGESIARGVSAPVQGFNDSVANFLGTPGDIAQAQGPNGLPGFSPMPNDIIANLARKAGVNLPIGTPGSADIKSGMDFVSTLPRRAMDAVRGTPQADYSSRITPENTAERLLYGAGRGAGDVATMMAGAGAIRAPLNSATDMVAQSLRSAPGTQYAASMAGSAVGEATDSPVAGIGTALGIGAAPSLMRAIPRPNISNLTPEQTRLVGVLKQEGITPSFGTETGSRPVQSLESVLGTLPFSHGMAKGADQKRAADFTAAALKRAGIAGNSATDDVLQGNIKTLGSEFDKTRPKAVALDNQLTEDMIAIGEKWWPKLDVTKKPVVEAYINQITDPKLGGQMDGAIYQETRSILGNQANSLKNSDYASFRALKDIRNSLDKAAERSMSPEQFAAFKETNRKYANTKTLLKAQEGRSADTAAGEITPARLQVAAGQSRTGDFDELAKAGTLLKPQVPNSGTPERVMWQSLLSGGAGGLALTGSMAGGAAMLGTAPMAQRLLQSKAVRSYFTSPKEPGRSKAELMAAALMAEKLMLAREAGN